MWKRTSLLAGLAALLAVIAVAVWWRTNVVPDAEIPGDSAAAVPVATGEADEPLPIPPVPPRIAQGADYERCLAMLNTDPSGARDFADAWFATGGGDGAQHCLALAVIALGEPDQGAEMLDTLGGHSKAPDAARSAVYGQAGQAWLMAGDPGRALGSTTLALSMTPEDADLLIDRSIADATLERYQDAVDDLTHALDIDGRRADALTFRAAAWRHLDRLELAQDDIDRAIAMDPEFPDALLERGILRQRKGDRAGARRDWEDAVRLSPDSATADLAQQNLALLDAGPERR